MQSPFGTSSSSEEIEVFPTPDAIMAMIKTLEGLSELAALEGLDTVVQKLDDAMEECASIMKGLGDEPIVYPTSS